MSGEVIVSQLRAVWARRSIRAAVAVLLLVNLQDLSTSLTRLSLLSPKQWFQWVLLVPLIVWCLVSAPQLLRTLHRLPIPRPALILFCGVLICQSVCILAEREVYPFSPVGMYGYPLQASRQEWTTRPHASPDFIVHTPDGQVQQLSLFREGDPLFASGVLPFDMKTTWVLEKYRVRQRAVVEQEIAEQLRSGPHRQVEKSLIQVNLRTGQTQYASGVGAIP